jgi:hypothetical protein
LFTQPAHFTQFLYVLLLNLPPSKWGRGSSSAIVKPSNQLTHNYRLNSNTFFLHSHSIARARYGDAIDGLEVLACIKMNGTESAEGGGEAKKKENQLRGKKRF